MQLPVLHLMFVRAQNRWDMEGEFHSSAVVWSFSCFVCAGLMQIGGQEHFYLETNASLVVPGEGGSMEIFASTQNPTKTQDFCARVCGLDKNKVIFRCLLVLLVCTPSRILILSHPPPPPEEGLKLDVSPYQSRTTLIYWLRKGLV